MQLRIPLVVVLFGSLCACKQKAPPTESPVEFTLPPIEVPGKEPRPFVAVAAGAEHGLALDDQGKVHAWGRYSDGLPRIPEGLQDVVQIAAGSDFSLALRADGTVAVWGDPLGLNDPLPPLPGKVARIAAANRHFVLILADGSARIYGFMANAGKSPRMRAIVDAAVGDGFVLLLNKSGKVELWTMSKIGTYPTLPRFLAPVKAIAAGDHHGLAWLGDNRVEAWGPDYEGETQVPNLGPVRSIAGGCIVSYALLVDGSIHQWGNRKNGEDKLPPDLGKAKAIAAGHYSCTLALSASGRLFAWGHAANPCVSEAPTANNP